MAALATHIIGHDAMCCEDSQLRIYTSPPPPRNATVDDCWRLCEQEPRCLFFHSARGVCDLCSGCARREDTNADGDSSLLADGAAFESLLRQAS